MTARSVDEAIASIAVEQHGIFSRDQAKRAGASRKVIRARLHAGAWIAHSQDVFRARGAPETWLSSLWTAMLSATAGSAVSHEAAAALHGLATFQPGAVTVTVPHADARIQSVATVHQSRRLYADHVTTIERLPVTGVARTVIDLAALLRKPRLELVLDSALSARKVSVQTMCRTFDDLACRGRKGTRQMRELLVERAPGYVAPASVLEGLFLRLLRDNGLPRPVLLSRIPARR